MLEKKLTIDREKLTYVISVSFKSKDPVKAARIANALADASAHAFANANASANANADENQCVE